MSALGWVGLGHAYLRARKRVASRRPSRGEHDRHGCAPAAGFVRGVVFSDQPERQMRQVKRVCIVSWELPPVPLAGLASGRSRSGCAIFLG
jgi:hypothetical protein